MNCIVKKYSLSVLLTFLMLVAVSCQKGGEPVPYSNGLSVKNSNGLVGNSSQKTLLNTLDAGSSEEEGSNAPEGGSNGGDLNNDDNVVIGGDDNEDDDDGGGKIGINNGGDDGDDDDSGNGGNISNTGGGK